MPILRARRHFGVLLLVAIFIWIEPVHAQTERLHTIQIGSHVLAVGMEEAVVLRSWLTTSMCRRSTSRGRSLAETARI